MKNVMILVVFLFVAQAAQAVDCGAMAESNDRDGGKTPVVVSTDTDATASSSKK
jgi:hypothetical protein